MTQQYIDKADISDVLIERPVSFTLKGKRIFIYPASLGKLQLAARIIEAMGLSKTRAKDIYHLAKKVADVHRNECLRLISYYSLPGDECLNESKVLERIDDLAGADANDIASLLVIILRQDKTQDIEKHFSIDKERKRLASVMAIKKRDKSNPTFGGKSLWGNIIDVACERYGWTYQYVLWGISYANLHLLFADQMRQVFLTDEERKQLNIPKDGIIINVEDTQALEQFIAKQSWK